MTDLTKITTPFGLLDPETKAALKAHGGPWEYASDATDWLWKTESRSIACFNGTVYRVKPAPPKKPGEWWCVMHTAYGKRIPHGWSTSREGALDLITSGCSGSEIVHVREVLPE